eukprot:Gb_34925 [translate_table: standard]
MASESKENVRKRAQDLQTLVRGPLASSLQNLNNSARTIPMDKDFHFYSNFLQFREPIINLKNHSESLLRDVGASEMLWKRPLPWPEDPDDAYDLLVNMQDDIFERVDISMDEFKRATKEQENGKPGSMIDIESGFQLVYGNRKKGNNKMIHKAEAPGSKMVSKVEAPDVKMASRDKKTTGGRSRVPFHIPSIPRPQDRFSIFVDNSNVPFKHLGLRKTEDGSKFIHPLQEVLNKLEFADKQSTAPEPLDPSPWESTPFKFIERVQDLKDMARKLQSAGEIAVDLEHNQYRSFQGLTCLMQISTRSEDFVVDTLILHNHIGPYLGRIFADPAIKKVMHGADHDILWLQRDFGIYVCNLFDTGQASRVLQLERNSLEFLLQHFCGITADKEYQTADWRLRPLPSEMLKYAREDTHYLLYVQDLMKKRLVSAMSECGETPLLEVYKRSRDVCLQLYEKELLTETSYLHVYGLQEGNFSPEQLAVVAGLYEWRDKIARVEDESTGYILPNKVLLQIAKKLPSNLDELRAFVKGRHPFVERNLAAVLDVIRQSREKKSKFIESAPKQPGQVVLKESVGLNEQSLTGNQDMLHSIDTATAVNFQTLEGKVISAQGLDINGKSTCEKSVDGKKSGRERASRIPDVIKDVATEEPLNVQTNSSSEKAEKGETNLGKHTESWTETKQAEFVSSSSNMAIIGSAADTFEAQIVPCNKGGLVSAVVGRACSSLLFNKRLFNKKYESLKDGIFEAISNDCDQNNLIRQPVTEVSVPLSTKSCSSERLEEVSLNREKEHAKQAQDMDLGISVELSGELLLNKSGMSGHTSLESEFVAHEEYKLFENISAKVRVASVQPKKKPGRGLAAMLGPSSSKQKSDASIKVHDHEQDKARSKVEQIKASVTLPFQSFSGTCETFSSMQSGELKESPTNDNSHSEEVKAGCDENASQIENDIPLLKQAGGIFKGEEGKQHRAWWPQLQVSSVGKKAAIRELNDKELPPSLSELRRKSWQHSKKQSTLQSLEDIKHTKVHAPHEDTPQMNDFLNGKKRKNVSQEAYDSSKTSSVRALATECKFKPFDYAAARQSICSETSDKPAKEVKDRNAIKNVSFSKKGKSFVFDPLSRVARESSAEGLQPGKRRQVFPASGNRSATFH